MDQIVFNLILWGAGLNRLLKNYAFLELGVEGRKSPLPTPPNETQKYAYVSRRMGWLVAISIFGFACITLSVYRLATENLWLIPLLFLLAYTVTYFVISQLIYFRSKDFDVDEHRAIVGSWRPDVYPSIDIFLPTCGEPLDVLVNTWRGVHDIARSYPGVVNVMCLDDARSSDARLVAQRFGFQYHSRPDRGWFKKAGNLRYGFVRSSGEFIVIFDADFRPREDFLKELLPYFYADRSVGIVQTPQYFEVLPHHNWIERGAGAVQELFYRAVQTSRQDNGGAICVGSNAIYRRAALEETGGTALIEHSEDVHTGFNLKMAGWNLKYIPLVLAKGLCPNDLEAFFKQQYRWCMGSMSLLTSRKFWTTKLPIRTRLCYLSGFMYYIHTAIYSVLTPLIPLIMIFAIPEQIKLANYLLIFPSLIYMHIFFPLWHRVQYGIEAASIRTVYGWAHLIAITDKLLQSAMEWQPTGATARKKNPRYRIFRLGVVFFNLVPALFWIAGALAHIATSAEPLHFVPILLLGIYYFFMVLKITVYRDADAAIADESGDTDRIGGKLWVLNQLRIAEHVGTGLGARPVPVSAHRHATRALGKTKPLLLTNRIDGREQANRLLRRIQPVLEESNGQTAAE